MFTHAHLLRVLTVATLTSVAGAAHAQQAYFSVQSDLDVAGSQFAFDLDLSRQVTSAETLFFQTFTGSGGTNAAGDVIPAGAFDSVLSLATTSSSAANVSNDHGGLGTDALLGFQGAANGGFLPPTLPAEA